MAGEFDIMVRLSDQVVGRLAYWVMIGIEASADPRRSGCCSIRIFAMGCAGIVRRSMALRCEGGVMAAIDAQVSTGIAGLDRVFRGIMAGDNIVWQVDSIDD